MKLGFLVLAHEKLDALRGLLNALTSFTEDCVILHIDKKSPLNKEINQIKNEFPDAILVPSIDVVWGESSIVDATLRGMEAALSTDIDYLILLSGTAMPIQGRTQLINFLEQKKGTDFIECHNPSSGKWVIDGLEKERWEHYNFFNWRIDPIFFSVSHKIQRKFKVRRKLPGNIAPMLGSQWWCLSIQTVDKVVEFTKNHDALKYLKRTWIPDEFYIQSVVSHVKNGEGIEPILMYYRFNDAGIPKVFSIKDIKELENAKKYFFARKINLKDSKMVERLKDNYKESNVSIDVEDITHPIPRSRKKFIHEIGIYTKLSPVFIFISNKNIEQDIKNTLEKVKENFPMSMVYHQLFSKSIIDYGLEEESKLYNETDVILRDYNIESFISHIFDNGKINIAILDIKDFDKVNYYLMKNPLVKYVFYPSSDFLDYDLFYSIIKKIRFLNSQGLNVIESSNLDDLFQKVLSEIKSDPFCNRFL
ncbi:beta-1,6-N-acetylglucosaminyltransferase [Pantoea sp. NGS-ED-1003]|uniref:beta-1,6-N-acetylglucosaminyltransferase n=1 Tax=Pantoea sp. NGS-ED-1003 TaxID=1526743 RepID=UPI000535882A|nr:beta-1,6-N-acetylglucosaminyltransferase [Pantoea sp. NGS-ED-1003]